MAKPEGAALILAIHHASILKLGLDGYSPEECASWAFGKKASDFVAAMEVAGEKYLLAERDGEALGFASYLADRIVALYVMPSTAGQRVGAALMARAEGLVWADGHRLIHVEASASGRDFYRACGYVEVGELQRASRGGMMLRTFDMVKCAG